MIMHMIIIIIMYLIRLRKGKVKMVLGNGQYYCINLAEEQYSIKLSIVLLPSHNHSADERKKLLHFFQGTLVSLVAEFMPATKKPIAYIPCFYCDHLHVEVELLLDGQQQDCPVVDKPIPPQHYQSLITDQGLSSCLVKFVVFNLIVVDIYRIQASTKRK